MQWLPATLQHSLQVCTDREKGKAGQQRLTFHAAKTEEPALLHLEADKSCSNLGCDDIRNDPIEICSDVGVRKDLRGLYMQGQIGKTRTTSVGKREMALAAAISLSLWFLTQVLVGVK